jgi:hypothetical protein
MMFSGARGYIGTLFSVLSSEAAAVATKLLDDYCGEPLAVALWLAQRDVYGSDLRRPYVVGRRSRNALKLNEVFLTQTFF